MIHLLKTLPVPFAAVKSGQKTHEVRDNSDRNFSVGDTIHLAEWTGETFTGDSVAVVITYVSAGGTWGLPSNIDVLSIRSLE